MMRSTHVRPLLSVCVLAAATAGLFASAAVRATESGDSRIPGAPHLLPDRTLAYARIGDANNMRSEFADSSVGRMLRDPEMEPFATDVYALAAELFSRVRDEVGVSLDELLAIPSGQAAVALLPATLAEDEPADNGGGEQDEIAAARGRIERKQAEGSGFAGVAMIDAGENVESLRAIVTRLEERILGAGFVRRESDVGGTTLVRLLPPAPGKPPVEYFERDRNVVFGIGHRSAADVLDRWLERTGEPSLADSADFAAVMTRSVGAEATRPQVTFFADPYHIVERLMNRGGGAALLWPIVEDLGISKIRGVGGSIFRGGEYFEDLSHFHVLIDPPRDGLFGVLRPEAGETTPPSWVPADVTSYSSVHWDFDKAFENLVRIVNRFQGEGTFDENVTSRLEKRFGVDLRDDIIGNLAGRYVGVRWLEPPARINSQCQLYAVKINEPSRARDTLDQFRDRSPNALRKETIAGKTVYMTRSGERGLPQGLRRPEPCWGLFGEWFIFSDSKQLLERTVRARAGGLPRLVDQPEYLLVSSELGGKLDGEDPFMVSFLRSSDFIRQMYEMAQSDDTRRFLRDAGENNVVARKFYELLLRNELPPYERFEQYFAPGGMFGYDEPTGIHFGTFTLRAQR